MIRANNLIAKITDPDNLRLAFWKARKGKSHSVAVQKYRENLDENLLILRDEINTGEVNVGDYRFFQIYEPKEREICASAFRSCLNLTNLICEDNFPPAFTFKILKDRGVLAVLKVKANEKYSLTYENT